MRARNTQTAIALSLALIILAVFPWRGLQDHPHWARVAWIPFVSPPVRLRDIIVNALLFAPFGAALAGRGRLISTMWIGGAALLVSVLGELTQLYSHTRFPSATDVTMNVAGAVGGAWWRARRNQRAGSPRSSSAIDAERERK